MCKFLAPTGAGEGKKRGFLLRRAPLEATTAVFGFNGSGWREKSWFLGPMGASGAKNPGFLVQRAAAEGKIWIFRSNRSGWR